MSYRVKLSHFNCGVLASVTAAVLLFAGTLVALQPQVSSTANTAAASPIPRLIKFSGTLLDEQGHALKGPVGVTFSLYAQQSGGAALWLETQSVKPDATGNYTVLLGAVSTNGIPEELFASGEARWLGVQTEDQAEQPRVLLVSVPYALKAGDAQTLGGLPASAFLQAQGPATSSAALVPLAATSTPGSTTLSFAIICPSVNSIAGGKPNFMPKFVGTSPSCTIENSQIFDNGTNVGIGFPVTPTPTPVAKLDVNGTANIRGTFQLPATGTANSTTKGFSSQPFDLLSSVFNGTAAVNQHFRWQAEAVKPGSAAASGKLNLLFASGAGTPAETGLTINNAGILQAPLGMLLYHASFQGSVQTLAGTNSKVTPFDGFVILQTDGSTLGNNGLVDLTSNNPQSFTPYPGLNKQGAFLSLRLKSLLGPANPGQPAYFVAGQAGFIGSNGLGFKTLGGADCGGGVTGGGLNGVTILNGTETLVNLGAVVCPNGPPVDLLAVRQASSVNFYVNGALKGTSTTNLPSTPSAIYELRLTNSTTLMGSQTFSVSSLTVGIPMF